MKNNNPTKRDDPAEKLTGDESMREDHEIIRKVLNGHVNAYEKLVKKYQQPVFQLLVRMLHDQEQARELLQQVFVQSYEALGSFRFQHKYFSWLYRIAINLALNELKKQKKYVGLNAMSSMEGEALESTDHKEELLESAIDRLKEKYRLLITLKYYQNMSYQEIARSIDIPEKRVRSRLFEARLKLKEILIRSGYF